MVTRRFNLIVTQDIVESRKVRRVSRGGQEELRRTGEGQEIRESGVCQEEFRMSGEDQEDIKKAEANNFALV